MQGNHGLMVLDSNSFVVGTARPFGDLGRSEREARDLVIHLSGEAQERLGEPVREVRIPFRFVASYGWEQIRLDGSFELMCRVLTALHEKGRGA